MNSDDIKEVISDGIYSALKKVLFKVCKYWLVVYSILLLFSWYQGEFDKDSTDGIKRSNMELHTDQLTGCQYLSASGGGITPRISRDGHHQGCKSITKP